ncbi:Hypothetical predicted protein [Octopus vulgaris]|uniref:Uncharacterized protein n=1 Tax=Octopus vulgaris TaxID=6645 RepID=A0AA36FKQ4_OCTVU|nr:Hypothetical predicted protein [Octopus vulgaris]
MLKEWRKEEEEGKELDEKEKNTEEKDEENDQEEEVEEKKKTMDGALAAALPWSVSPTNKRTPGPIYRHQ